METVRFGISLDKDLLNTFDNHIFKKGYPSRSEAIRDLIRNDLVKEDWKTGGRVAGAITLIYDHHVRDLQNKLTEVQHHFPELIISTQHVHLDHDNCLEIIAVRGGAKEVRTLAERLQSTRGVKHSTLHMSSIGDKLK
jgi:CopG family transcriptional regulator, nickel-responsive regulator